MCPYFSPELSFGEAETPAAVGFTGSSTGAPLSLTGSPQEFDQTRILGRFLEHDEFGPSGRHALGFQEQVAEVFVAAAASQQ